MSKSRADSSSKDESGAGDAAATASKLHLWQIQGVRDVLLIVMLAAIVYVGYWIRSVTVPLLIALALAYLFEPVVQRLCRFRGITRPGAVLIILLNVGVVVAIVFTFAVPLAIGQTVKLINEIRSSDLSGLADRAIEYAPEQYRADLQSAVQWLERQMGQSGSARGGVPAPAEGTLTDTAGVGNAAEGESSKPAGAPPPAIVKDSGRLLVDHTVPTEDARVREIVRQELAGLGIESADSVSVASSSAGTTGAPWRILGAIGSSAERVMDFLLALVQVSLILFLVPFYFYFFSVSFPSLLQFSRGLIPQANRARTLELISAMDRAVSGFVRGRIVIALLMGVLFALGWLLCGVPYAVTLGLFVGALSLVPYLGGIGVPLAVGLLLFSQLQLHPSERMAWWEIILWPSLVFVVVQAIEGYILTPIISGKATDLDPVTIVVAILAGGSVAGVYGMLLAIPAAACGKILLREVFLPRMRAWSRGEAPDPLPLQTSSDS